MNKMKSFFVVQGGDDEWDGHRRHRSNSTRRGSHLQRTERRRGTLGTNRSLHQVCAQTRSQVSLAPAFLCSCVCALCVCVCQQQSSRSIRNDLAEYYHPEPSSSRLQLPQLFGSNARPRPPTPVKNRKRRRE